MHTSILSLMLAFGLPGANSCSAQQQGLPRVGQTPPVATSQEETPVVADTTEESESSEADEPSDEVFEMEPAAEPMEEADEAPEALEPMEMDIVGFGGAESTPPCDTKCESKCEGSSDCQPQTQGQLGSLFTTITPDGRVQNGHVLHVKEKDLGGQGQTLTIAPGSTVILETKNGKQVTLRSQLGTTAMTAPLAMNGTGTFSFGGFAGMPQAAPQGDNQRVRELEQRVRELEAQLRERDGQRGHSSDAFGWGPAAAPEAHARDEEKYAEDRARAGAERARAGEMRARMSQQSREIAQQARKQAAEMRAQADELRQQAIEQSRQWHARVEDGQNQPHWKVLAVPRGVQPPAPDARAPVAVPDVPGVPSPAIAEMKPLPGMAPAPVEPPPGGYWMRTPNPNAPRTARAARAPQAEHAQEMHAMLEEMKAQMQEMREQMQALREELQNAPKREMR